MTARLLGRCALALLPLLPAAASAQEAFTRQAANVRAGPDRSYPLVTRLGPGAPLRVMGCLEDWTWCDVAFDDNRGWVYGPFLLYDVPGDRVSLYTYGPSLGIAVIGFSLGGYWDEHYRQRPWYGGRADWERRAPPPHRVPEGLPPHAVYTAGMHPDRGEARPAGRPTASGQDHAARSAAGQGQEASRGQAAAPHREPQAPVQAAHREPAAQPASAARQPPPAQGAPARENSRGNPQHAEPQARQEAPRQVQHAPTQQREPAPQHEAAQQHEQPQARQSGGERGGGEKGGGEKPERDGR